MIEVKNVTKKYGKFIAVDNISFTINEGEIIGLLGPNGAGKSTTMNMLTGFIEQTEGEIIIDGYTDTDGDYSYNLELSQKRSLAVAQYLLDIKSEFLKDVQVQELQDCLTVNGHSMSDPVLDADGKVDKDASRRVEVKFRLKDEEMIQELNKIMQGDASSSVDKIAAESGKDSAKDSGTGKASAKKK